MMKDELVAGIIIKGSEKAVEEIIDFLESSKKIKLIYVQRAKTPCFLLILRTRREGGNNYDKY
ncbi:MAG: hypothetical protein QXL22_05725 [Candidatus Nezhaarchaeales archaeon]